MILEHSQSDIMVKYLISLGLAVTPGPGLPITAWPMYIDQTPNMPDRMHAIHCTAGRLDGRYHDGGRVIEHPGISIVTRVRPGDYRVGYKKANELAEALDQMTNELVVISPRTYKVASVSRTSSVLSIGQDTSNRDTFTVNANCVITVHA